MKNSILCLMLSLGMTGTVISQSMTLPPSGDNQKSAVTQYIGSIAHVTVEYSSPDVDGRTGQIWGQLVPYGLTDLGFGLRTPAPWRAGANENTRISFSHDVMIEGKPLPAGTYGLHLITAASGPWTWIFSNNSTAWGSFFYKENEDALRIQVTPDSCPFQEWLTYEFDDRNPTSAVLALKWEHKRVPMRIEVKDPNDLYITVLEQELENSQGFNSQNWAAAANFLAQQNYRLDKALEWSEASISAPFIGQENWNTLQTKALIQLQMGETEEGKKTVMAAVNHPTAQSFQIHYFGRQLITQGHKELALDVFQANYDRFEGAWPTNVGMARGLSALGRYDEAMKYAKLAQAEAPDQLNKDSMAQAVEKLARKEDIN